MALIEVSEPRPDGAALAAALESGAILSFPGQPLALSPEHLAVLRRQNPGHSRFHKNIAYRPESGRMSGLSEIPREDRVAVHLALEEFSGRALRFLADLFPTYARSWRVDYTSFRPYEEEGRPLSPRSRNDLMHVDAFPSRPTNGDRILRLFVNIHPSKDRVWISGGNFEHLAERYAVSSGILRSVEAGRREGALAGILRATGLRKGRRSAYDEFMLRFHDFLKENEDFQTSAPREELSFPPGSTWLVFTDGVSHAVLSGRHALEQTFLIARDSLAISESAPISILERLAGRKLSLGAAA
jgi:3-deoxy-D-manno-oct-2-ulosonic acid (Kdo) hydroxylase